MKKQVQQKLLITSKFKLWLPKQVYILIVSTSKFKMSLGKKHLKRKSQNENPHIFYYVIFCP